MPSKGIIKVKLAGGAAAQCIALMNSIYLQKKLKKIKAGEPAPGILLYLNKLD